MKTYQVGDGAVVVVEQGEGRVRVDIGLMPYAVRKITEGGSAILDVDIEGVAGLTIAIAQREDKARL